MSVEAAPGFGDSYPANLVPAGDPGPVLTVLGVPASGDADGTAAATNIRQAFGAPAAARAEGAAATTNIRQAFGAPAAARAEGYPATTNIFQVFGARAAADATGFPGTPALTLGPIGPTAPGYEYTSRSRTFLATPTVVPPVTPVPPTIDLATLGIPRVSETYPQPVVLNGIPYADTAKHPWLPSSTSSGVWAKQLQVIVNGQDVTFFRDMPAVVQNWGSQQPFGDSAASVLFPGITSFDHLPVPQALPIGEVAGIARTYTGNGYWQASALGLVTSYGDAAYFGDVLGLLDQSVTGIAAHPSGQGYALCAADGGVFCFGDVPFNGSLPGLHVTPTAPVIGIALTTTGNGYWLVGQDGGVFAFGDAVFLGSAPVIFPGDVAVGITRSSGGSGYVIASQQGGVYCFGDAVYHGNGIPYYEAPYTGLASHPTTDGYLLVNSLGAAYCQPAGTLVRVVSFEYEEHGTYSCYSYNKCRCVPCCEAQRQYQRDYRAGTRQRKGPDALAREIPIETVRPGDRVVSFDPTSRRVRREGRKVTAVIKRPFSGRLVTVTTSDGVASRYTPEHKCIALVGDALTDRHVVYMMRRGTQYRIGRTQGRMASQSGNTGLSTRCRAQGGDAMWVLSVHESRSEAALAEALLAHEHGLPTWEFRGLRPDHHIMDLDAFWSKVGDNTAAAGRCLTAHGRDIRYPFWTSDRGVKWTWYPHVYQACNLLDGMKVLALDHAVVRYTSDGGGVDGIGGLFLTETSGVPIVVGQEWFDGEVVSLEVEGDHTYIADGIVTHNCFGGEPYEGGCTFPLDQPVNSVAVTPSGNGYWMNAGDGGVFAFGDAPFLGSIPGGGTVDFGSLSWLRLGAPITINYIDPANVAHTLFEGVLGDWEDAAASGSDIGLTVQCVGALFQLDWYVAKPIFDLPFLGYNPDTGSPVFGWDIGTAISTAINSAITNPTPGTAIGAGWTPPEAPGGSPLSIAMCRAVNTGILTVQQPQWDKLLTGYIQNILAQAQTLGGLQWTVGLQRPRTPVIELKELDSIDWTVTCGGRGISHHLSLDITTAANAIFGQGTAPTTYLSAPQTHVSVEFYQSTVLGLSGSWANSQYPQVPTSAPGFPLGAGLAFRPGSATTGLQPFTNWMRQCGYLMQSQDTYLANNVNAGVLDQVLIENFQQFAGLQVTGNVDATTWNAAFAVGQNAGSVTAVHYAPLAELPEVEPYSYTPSGATVGNNPAYQSRIPRIERFEQMGQQITKAQGMLSAQIELERVQVPSWTGTIELSADPEEGSRFQILAGQNILLRFFHGQDTLFHISAVHHDFTKLSSALTVSTQAMDLPTLSSIWARDAQAHGVARQARPNLVNLNVSQNTTVFDSESGAGRVPLTSLGANQWTVVRVPFSQSGSVAEIDLTSSSPATAFAMAVFSGPVGNADLVNAGIGAPLTANGDGNSPWNDAAAALDNLGLLYAAGGPGAGCGFWPSDPASAAPTLSGRYVDGNTWPYAPAPGYSPWLWVAFWVATGCSIEGNFRVAPTVG